MPHGLHAKVARSLFANEALVLSALCRTSRERASAIMDANTSSRGHPLQHQVLVSPILEEMDQSPTGFSTPKAKAPQTTVTHVPSWPEEGRTLNKHDWVSVLFALGDVLLVALPIYFICMWHECYLCFPTLNLQCLE